jgi:hypothetical protein
MIPFDVIGSRFNAAALGYYRKDFDLLTLSSRPAHDAVQQCGPGSIGPGKKWDLEQCTSVC